MRISLIYSRLNTSIQVPLGLLWIAAVLENEGHKVQVIDPISAKIDYVDLITKFRPDLIGVSIITTEYQKAAEIFGKLQKAIPDALYCAGGVHATALPQRTLEDFNLNFVVAGEGEYVLRDVCANIEHGRPFESVNGVCYKKDGKYIQNPRYELIKNMDELPLPARHLLDMEWYLTPPGLVRGALLKRSAGLLAARGCSYECIYCGSNNIFGRRVRKRSVQNVVGEIEFLIKKYSIDGYYFYDDTFTIDKNYVLEFCRMLKERRITLKWGCQIRVNTVWEDVLKEMRETGCMQVDIGVESGSDNVLKNLKKGTNVETVKKAFKMIRKSGIRTLATFTLGNPGETKEDIELTRKLAGEISPDYVRFFYLTPFPGSELYDDALRNNWIDRDVKFSQAWQIRQADDPVMSINFTRKELRKIRADLQNNFLLGNYCSLIRDNWRFAFIMIGVILRHPVRAFKEIIRVFRTGRIDYIIEAILEWYRLDEASAIQLMHKG